MVQLCGSLQDITVCMYRYMHIFCMFTYSNDGYNMNHIDRAVKCRDITFNFAERSFDIFFTCCSFRYETNQL